MYIYIYIYIGVYTHIHDGILLSHKKEKNWVICDVDRSRVCHRVKSVRKTKTSIVQQSMNLECRKMVTWACLQGRNREENRTDMWTWQGVGKGRGRGETNWESRLDMCTLWCVNSQWEAAIRHQELSWVLRDDLGSGTEKGRRRFKRKGMYVYIQLFHFVAQQKLTL